MDKATGLNVKKYIVNGRKLLKMQKSIYAFDEMSFVNKCIFFDRLEFMRNNVDSLETWRSYTKLKSTNKVIQDFLKDAPPLMAELISKITYV